jgi:hypothetical protein
LAGSHGRPSSQDDSGEERKTHCQREEVGQDRRGRECSCDNGENEMVKNVSFFNEIHFILPTSEVSFANAKRALRWEGLALLFEYYVQSTRQNANIGHDVWHKSW